MVETTPRQNDQRKTSPSEVYRVSRPLIPRSYSTPATFILVKFCLAGQILSTRTLSGLRIGGRLTNRPCMDSAEGDTIVRFRAPGSIRTHSTFSSPPLSSLQQFLNRDPWKRQPRQRPSSQESPPVETVAPSDTSSILYSPRGKVERICTDLRRSTPLEALPWKPKKLVPA